MSKSSFFLGAVTGAAALYFLDPDSGNRRRSLTSDKLGKYARRGSQAAQQQASRAAGATKGAAVETVKSAPGVSHAVDRQKAEQLNDPALARKVETEIFRDADAPKGKVNVNVENGIVYLRGEVENDGQIEQLVAATRAVEGVGQVKNLLHTPGSPAPTKS